MKIEISDKYLVTSDKYRNWILKEKRIIDPNHPLAKSDTQTERWVDIGYYGKLEHVLNSLLEKELKASECISIQDLKEALFQIENKLRIEASKIVNVG